MKRFLFLTGIVAILCSACSSNDDDEATPDGRKATLTVSIGGSDDAASNGTRGVGAPTQTEENEIHSFTVYVFANNILEKSVTSTTGLSVFIDNLTTGAKRVVVVANTPPSFPVLAEGAAYSQLASPSSYISLDDQTDDLSNGLVMSGEANATLQAESAGNNTLSIQVSRIVAKIKLGTITIDPSDGQDPDLLTLTGVAIIKAHSLSSVGIPSVVTTTPFFSGIEGVSVHPPYIRDYLYENIELDDHDERYFYVFANENDGDEATLMTLEGTYDGETVYFPFRITPIQPNTQHTVNVTLRRLGAGSPDPEVPSDPATLTVTVVPENWVVVPNHNVEW